MTQCPGESGFSLLVLCATTETPGAFIHETSEEGIFPEGPVHLKDVLMTH